MDYYTYAYLRADGTPYYIGKGKGNRAYRRHWKSKTKGGYFDPPEKSRILILKKELTEESANQHEIYMINIFGRKDNNTGILRNLTNGGEGMSGVTPWNKGKKNICPPHQREINREIMKERYKNGLNVKGANNPRAKTWKIVYNNGNEITVKGLQRWAIENGYSVSGIKNMAYCKWSKYKDIISVTQLL